MVVELSLKTLVNAGWVGNRSANAWAWAGITSAAIRTAPPKTLPTLVKMARIIPRHVICARHFVLLTERSHRCPVGDIGKRMMNRGLSSIRCYSLPNKRISSNPAMSRQARLLRARAEFRGPGNRYYRRPKGLPQFAPAQSVRYHGMLITVIRLSPWNRSRALSTAER